MQDAQDAPKHDVKIRESTKSLFGNSACEDERTQGRKVVKIQPVLDAYIIPTVLYPVPLGLSYTTTAGCHCFDSG